MTGPSDCDDILKTYDIETSGAYYIYPNTGLGPVRMRVWCDMDRTGGGWTVSTSSNYSIRVVTNIIIIIYSRRIQTCIINS